MATQPTQHTATQPAAQSARIPQWEMGAITCRLDARDYDTIELCVVPHSDPSLALIERFEAPRLALQRHAELLEQLRKDGWAVIDQGSVLGIRSAA